jgi:glycosyltransferase involved in cell wall biosynthesis
LPQSPKDNKTITIVHNGAFFYYGKDPFPFLQGVRLLLQQQTVQLKIKFVGTHPTKILPTLQEWGLTDVVECIPFLPRIESLPYLLAADILLLITGPIHGVLTAKVFEYLYTNRPILSLNAERGILTDYLEEANTGRIVTSTSPQEIAGALSSLIQDVKEQRLPDPNRSFIARFEYKQLTSQLAQVLDQLGA